MQLPIPVFVINSNSFDWLTFFLGGALGSFLGALIILGIERLIEYILLHRRTILEKRRTCQALISELNKNIILCDEIGAALSRDILSIRAIGEFKSVWLEIYSEKYIDFLSEESRSIYVSIRDSQSYMRQISKFEENILMLSVTGTALTNYTQNLQRRNEILVNLVQKLKETFENIKSNPFL